MTTILLVSLVVCYVVQLILTSVLGESKVWRGLFRVDDFFALSNQGLKHGYYWQLITFQFMHAGIFHILGNMLGLYFFGRAMEEMLGSAGMLRLYLLSGTIGGLVQVALGLAFPVRIGAGPVVGASAGVFGLVAAFATRAPEQPITLLVLYVIPVTFKAKWILLVEAVISVAGLVAPGLSGGIAHGAHLGGMLTGIIYAKWADWFERAGAIWRPAARARPARAPVGASPQRALRRPRKKAEELPSAEFISREVDPILEKISAQGIHSLTAREREILEAARNKMAKR
jgi:membrane associated rhomboid family serine protease